MDAQSRDVVTFILGTLISLTVLAGLATKFILLPWLRDHLVEPVKETQRQVSENGHVNDPPTVPDMIHSVQRDVGAISRVMDEHLSWSERWTDLIEREVELVRREIRAHLNKNGDST